MNIDEGKEYVMRYFERARGGLKICVEGLSSDPEAVLNQAESILRQDIMNKLAYLDAPRGTIAGALFFSAVHLAVWKALKEEEEDAVDVHDFGAAILNNREHLPPIISDDGIEENWTDSPGTHPGEWQIEFVEDVDYDMAYNVTSCAECGLYAQYDAMDLMPYMCASDDFDASMVGLRRTKTIALGHDHCDFRFREGDRAKILAELFPERIRWKKEKG